jgi:deazaflavin-dependent oxidoreductase (nitroreductase family)
VTAEPIVDGTPDRRPLPHSQTIDLTTTGRRTGLARRIEIVLHNFDGRLYITGMPNSARQRAWLLNLRADPRLILHLHGAQPADLAGTARVIDDEAERRAIFARVVRVWRGQDVETMTRYSPLIEVTLDGQA